MGEATISFISRRHLLPGTDWVTVGHGADVASDYRQTGL